MKNATLSKNEEIVNELMEELEVLEQDLINLEDRREAIYQRIDALREDN